MTTDPIRPPAENDDQQNDGTADDRSPARPSGASAPSTSAMFDVDSLDATHGPSRSGGAGDSGGPSGDADEDVRSTKSLDGLARYWYEHPTLRRVALAIMALYLAFGFLGRPDFWGNHQESRRAEVSREMVEGGNGTWLIPTLNGRSFITKPPFFYWATAGSMAATGEISEWSARLPSAFMGLLGAMAVAWLARSWRHTRSRKRDTGVDQGRLAAGILLTSFAYLQYLRYAEIDVAFAALVGGATMLIARGLRDEARQGRWFAAYWAVVALAFMVKGPLALLFTLGGAILLAVLPATDRPPNRRWLTRLLLNPGIAIFVLIVIPYYLWLVLNVPHAWSVFYQETFARFGDNEIRRQWPWYYLLHPDVFLPWALFLPQTLWWAWKRGDRVARYLLWVFVVGLVMVSCVPSKKASYVLPLLPVLAVLTAAYLHELQVHGASAMAPVAWRRQFRYAQVVLGGGLILAGLVSLGVIAYLTTLQMGVQRLAVPQGWGGVVLSVIVGLPCVALAAAAVRLARAGKLTHAALAGVVVVGGLAGTAFQQVLPTLNGVQGVKQFAIALSEESLGKRLPETIDERLYAWRDDNFSLSFYSHRLVLDVHEMDELPDIKTSPVIYVITRRTRVPELETGLHGETIGRTTILLENLQFAPLPRGRELAAKYDLVLVRVERDITMPYRPGESIAVPPPPGDGAGAVPGDTVAPDPGAAGDVAAPAPPAPPAPLEP